MCKDENVAMQVRQVSGSKIRATRMSGAANIVRNERISGVEIRRNALHLLRPTLACMFHKGGSVSQVFVKRINLPGRLLGIVTKGQFVPIHFQPVGRNKRSALRRMPVDATNTVSTALRSCLICARMRILPCRCNRRAVQIAWDWETKRGEHWAERAYFRR
jgi:hypothetical protein